MIGRILCVAMTTLMLRSANVRFQLMLDEVNYWKQMSIDRQ